MNATAVITWLLVLCLVQGGVYKTSESIIVEVDDDEGHLSTRSVEEEFPDRWCRTREGNMGSCMSFRECYPFTNKPDLNELQAWVNGTRSTCHYFDSNGLKNYGICCYKGSNQTDTEATDTKQIGLCGSGPKQLSDPTDDTDRIIGGTEAQRGAWPFIVSIMNYGLHICGGTLISQYQVLTAAHCVYQSIPFQISRLLVVANTHTIQPLDPWSKQVKVRRVKVHETFNRNTMYNDIAILTLASPIPFSASVSPVCLPMNGDKSNFVNYQAAVIGWGTTKNGGNISPVLQQAEVKVQSNAQCAKSYGKDAPGGIISSMLCAASPGKDSCQGDSGGPLLARIRGKWVQIGIVSWGIGCGKSRYPGVYTRVTSFMSWIKVNSNNLH